MSASILTEDVLAICLILADGNVNASMEQIICSVEAYQELSDRHFGITRSDFRNSLHFLFHNGFPDEPGWCDYEETWCRKPLLRHWITLILNYDELYCNEEGEHWYPHEGAVPSEHNRMMRRFFSDTNSDDPESVMRFLGGLGKDRSLLLKCSRPGSSS